MADVRKVILASFVALGFVVPALVSEAKTADKAKVVTKKSVAPKTPVLKVQTKPLEPMKLFPISFTCKEGKIVLGVKAYNRGRPHLLRVVYQKKNNSEVVVDVLSNYQLNAKSYYFLPKEVGSFRAELMDTKNGDVLKEAYNVEKEENCEVLEQNTVPVVTPTPDPEIQKLKAKIKAQEDKQKLLDAKVKELEDKKNTNNSTVIVTIPKPIEVTNTWAEVKLSKEISLAPAADLRGTIQIPNTIGSGFSSVFAGIGGKVKFSDVATLRLLGGVRYNYSSFNELVFAGAAEVDLTPLDGMIKVTGRGEFYPAFLGLRSEGSAGISVLPYKPVPIRIGAYGFINPESWMVGFGPEIDYTFSMVNLNLKGVLVPSGLTNFGQFTGLVVGQIKY